MNPSWDDPSLAVASDSARRARYRALQSRWREVELGLPPGIDPRTGRPLGSLLPESAPADAQWLTPEIAAFVREQVPLIQAENGTLEMVRLQRNLLSSQPLCFNLLGGLDTDHNAAARILTKLTGWDIVEITSIRVEHAPAAAKARPGDRTAFDGFITYIDTAGAPGFIGIETKYTEPFSDRDYLTPAYEAATADPEGWWKPGAADLARHRSLNQLWRNTLLAQLHEQNDAVAGIGRTLVITAADDTTAGRAVAGISAVLDDPDQRLGHVELEQIVELALGAPRLAAWAAAFRRRYLDLDGTRLSN